MRARQVTEFTVEQYLAFESASVDRHEYVDGVVLAMAGGSWRHSCCAQSVGTALNTRLRGGPCRVGQSDLRVHVAASGLFTYPDLTVICGEPQVTAGRWPSLVNPTVIVEVLSKSTEGYDRGEKLDHYQTIPSLQAVILVSIKRRAATVWTRVGEAWSAAEYDEDSTIELACCGIVVTVAEFFDQIPAAGPGDDDDA